jgi:hypothetical protein
VTRKRIDNERGAALVIALLLAILIGAIAGALLPLTTTETLLSASYRQAYEASYGAEAAMERALHDLATLPAWSAALAAPPGNVTSTFVDGTMFPVGPDGRTIDLAALTVRRQRESDSRDGDLFGVDRPQWRLYAHAPIDMLALPPAPRLPVYAVVWVADDGRDGDGEPAVDANGVVLLHAEAFGTSSARRAVEAVLTRAPSGGLRLLAWR